MSLFGTDTKMCQFYIDIQYQAWMQDCIQGYAFYRRGVCGQHNVHNILGYRLWVDKVDKASENCTWL